MEQSQSCLSQKGLTNLGKGLASYLSAALKQISQRSLTRYGFLLTNSVYCKVSTPGCKAKAITCANFFTSNQSSNKAKGWAFLHRGGKGETSQECHIPNK
jgi:hypothetical protein